MYRLILELPLDITLVFKTPYERVEDAQEKAKTLPKGFSVVTEDGPKDLTNAFVVPIKEKPVKPEELTEYETEAKKPLVIGDTVFHTKANRRGKVVDLPVAEGVALVDFSLSEVSIVPLSELLRVKP